MNHKKVIKINLERPQCYFCTKEQGLEESDTAFMCKREGLERHHVFGGTGNRQQSEKLGLVVRLCPKHHRNGVDAVHSNCEKSLELKRYAQMEFEKYNSRELFVEFIGRNYLN